MKIYPTVSLDEFERLRARLAAAEKVVEAARSALETYGQYNAGWLRNLREATEAYSAKGESE